VKSHRIFIFRVNNSYSLEWHLFTHSYNR
jgi:hypothetical protein